MNEWIFDGFVTVNGLPDIVVAVNTLAAMVAMVWYIYLWLWLLCNLLLMLMYKLKLESLYMHLFIIMYRVLFSRTSIFTDFSNFLFYMKTVSPKYNIYVRIHCDTKALCRFIVIYQISMALLKYVPQDDYSYCLTWRVLCLTLCHHLHLLQQAMKDLVDITELTIFVSHGYIYVYHPIAHANWHIIFISGGPRWQC